ncbi:iron-containing alcohol dehydrogenase family protein [Enterococcus sp. AZ192]|uniref:iron-containing alcohol dehydrogenase family protein n=1 Tax=unclassified Enterococcus TaxID=2608891 RepID=UPI003D2CDE00
MIHDFKYHLPVEVHFKKGILKEILEYTNRLDMSTILILTNEEVSKKKWFEEMREKLCKYSIRVDVCPNVVCEPTDQSINAIAELFMDCSYDGIIGIGGGSCLDSAKAVNILLSAKANNIEDYLVPNSTLAEKKIPMILIPTTAGTGAEITRGTVLYNEQHKIKRGFSNGGCFADIALIDPLVAKTLKKEQIAASGVDALSHALESYLVNDKHEICRLFSISALKLITMNLEKLYQNNQNEEAAENMFLAGLLATMSFATGVGLTFSHHISDVLGPTYKIPHGFASVFTLVETIKQLRSKDKQIDEKMKNLEIAIGNSCIEQTLIEMFGNLQIPHFTEYASSINQIELDSLYNKINSSDYRGVALENKELKLVLRKCLQKEKVQ